MVLASDADFNVQQDAATSGIHVDALRVEAERAQERLQKQLNRLENELSSCQDAKRRLEAEVAMSIHAAHPPRTNSSAPRNGSSGACLSIGFWRHGLASL